MSTSESTLLPGYQLRLPSFEGPLDILLRLIERDQLAITEISLVAVTDQFLDYVKRLGTAPAETLAEFATVAARLILLKSRSLLPRPPSSEMDEADQDGLVRQLADYRIFRDAALQLADRDQRGAWAFARGAGIVIPAQVGLAPLAPHQPLSLARVIRRRFAQASLQIQSLPVRPMLSLREVVARALGLMAQRGHLHFNDILSPGADRHEALTAFLAVLVLVRRGVFDAHQARSFGEISLYPTGHQAEPIDIDGVAADD